MTVYLLSSANLSVLCLYQDLDNIFLPVVVFDAWYQDEEMFQSYLGYIFFEFLNNPI